MHPLYEDRKSYIAVPHAAALKLCLERSNLNWLIRDVSEESGDGNVDEESM